MKLDIYQDKAGQFRWREVDPDKPEGDPDRIVASSNDAFPTEAEAISQGTKATGLTYEPPPPPPPPPPPVEEERPILGASAERSTYGDLAWHLYLNVDGSTPGGGPPPSTFPALTNVKGHIAGEDPHTPAHWAEIAAGKFDASLTKMARTPGARIIVLNHEPMDMEGVAADYIAACRHEYTVMKTANPDLLVGPLYLDYWLDKGRLNTWWVGDDFADFAGVDGYAVLGHLGWDFDRIFLPWFGFAEAHGKKLLIGETAAPTGSAQGYYDSIRNSTNLSKLLGVWLWLSAGPKADYRVSGLTAAERNSLDALTASEDFTR
jgi:hypothetical protein